MSDYSIKKASIYAGIGMGFAGLVTTFRAAVHHAQQHFETLSEAFSYVAPPETIAVTAALCVTIGAAIEFSNWYNKKLDNEALQKKGLKAPTPPQR